MSTDNQSLIDIRGLLNAGAAQGALKEKSGFTPLVLVPEGYRTEQLPFAIDPPLKDHIAQQISLGDLDSFARYVKRYQSGTTIILAALSSSGGSFTALFDYHRGSKDVDGSEQDLHANTATGIRSTPANRVAHRANYPLPNSFPWQQWMGSNKFAFSQEKFGAFIDANIPDITAPDSASLLDMVLNFEMKSAVDFKSKMVRTTGARALTFTETAEMGGGTAEGTIKVPETLSLLMPIFQGGKPYSITAKLFYRVNNGKLTISYELYRPEQVIETAIKDVIADITSATGITPFVGNLG